MESTGLESRGLTPSLCDLGHCLGLSFLCEVEVAIPTSEVTGLNKTTDARKG